MSRRLRSYGTRPSRAGLPTVRSPLAERIMLALSMPDGVSYGHMEVDFTQHALDVIAERRLDFEWITRTMTTPQLVEDAADGTRHFLVRVAEQEGRVLRVVVNP